MSAATTSTAARRATYQDVLDAPAHSVAEIIDGALYTHPRPAPRHAVASTVLGGELGPPFHRGQGGPGGWWICGNDFGCALRNRRRERCGRHWCPCG